MNACKYKRMYAYVHCMMIKQNHNKLNNKKYNFIVVFARTPHLPSSLRRWCCGPVDVWLSWEALLLNVPRVSLGLLLLPLAHLQSLRPPFCFDAWDFLAKVHGVDVRAYGAALLSVCTFAACVIGVASTLLSMLDEPRARYGSCVLAARRAPSTLR